jgi:hypothetical protein
LIPDSSPNLLYYGDNLDVLRLHVKDETSAASFNLS